MNRLANIVIGAVALTAAFAAMLLGPRLIKTGLGEGRAGAEVQRTRPETLELTTPSVSPTTFTTDIPTYLTFTIPLPDPVIRAPKLQYLDTSKGKYITVGRMRDDGKRGDEVPGNRIFTTRIRLLESAGKTEIGVPLKKRLRTKGSVLSPPEFRIAAKKMNQAGIVTSPSVTLQSSVAVPLNIESGTPAPSAVVMVPKTIDIISSDFSGATLKKLGPEGYEISIHFDANTAGLPLPDWIQRIFYGDDGVDRTSAFNAITVDGLDGIQSMEDGEDGRSVLVWLDDSSSDRIITIGASPGGGEQFGNFDDNLPEIFSVIDSLHQ